MEPIDAANQAFKRLFAEPPSYWEGIVTEADVRLRVVNRIFVEILGWPYEEIHCENSAGEGFIDYRMTVNGLSRLIVEAKRDAKDLGVRPDKAGRFFKLDGPVLESPIAKKAIGQAIGYCGHKNAELACVTNGRQWVIFRGNRLGDGRDTLDGMASVFGGLIQVGRNFQTFYRLLSYESVSRFLFRSEFQHAEQLPGRVTNFSRSLRRSESRQLLNPDKLMADLERVMTAFFRNLTGDDDADLLHECFVRSKESDRAETRLTRISEDLLNQIRTVDTEEAQQLTDAIVRVKETSRNEFVLLVGTKGSGKSTFTERFFKKVLPPKVARQCVVVRVDLSESEGDEKTVTEWLNRTLLAAVEKAIFPDGFDYDHIQGMYFDEYLRWHDGTYKHLYERDKVEFKVRFGEHVERLRREQPHDYITRMLGRVMRSDKKVPCLVFDNADHFSIEFQERVFQYAHSIYKRVVCLALVPITDKTSWQLSRQGALQSFFVESLYLPAPHPKQVLQARIEYINKKIKEQPAEAGTGYFTERRIPLEIDNIRAFAGCLQDVFIKTEGVGDWIGNLSNYDIRRALELTREVVSSPHIHAHALLKTYLVKSAVTIDVEDVIRAIIRRKYDIFPLGDHKFIHNVFALTTEVDASPLLGLRILRYLDDMKFQTSDGEFRYVEFEELRSYFLGMGITETILNAWMEKLLESALCQNYDPTSTDLKAVKRLEVSASGHQHLVWACGDLTYLEAMMEVTPIFDRDTFLALERSYANHSRIGRLHCLKTFVDYLVGEDARYVAVPDDEDYDPQLNLPLGLSQLMQKLVTNPPTPSESKSFGVYIGSVINWHADEGYGFLRATGLSQNAYVRLDDLPGQVTPQPHARFAFETIENDRGMRATNVIDVT